MIGANINKKLNKHRTEKIFQLVQPYLEGKLLDFGCGNFLVGEKIIKKTKLKITGTDIKNRNLTDRKIIVYSGNKTPFGNKTFDVCMLNFVLHHASNPEKVLKECLRITKKRIIILEDTYSTKFQKTYLEITDRLFNFFSDYKTEKLNFKTKKEWKKIFQKYSKKTIQKNFKLYNWKPIKNVMFVLDIQ